MDWRYPRSRPKATMRQPLAVADHNACYHERGTFTSTYKGGAGLQFARAVVQPVKRGAVLPPRPRSRPVTNGRQYREMSSQLPLKKIVMVLEERQSRDGIIYVSIFEDGSVEKLSRNFVLQHNGGRQSLQQYHENHDDLSEEQVAPPGSGPTLLEKLLANQPQALLSKISQFPDASQDPPYEDDIGHEDHRSMYGSSPYDLRKKSTSKRPRMDSSSESDSELSQQSNISDLSYNASGNSQPRKKKPKHSNSYQSWKDDLLGSIGGTPPKHSFSQSTTSNYDVDHDPSQAFEMDDYQVSPERRRSSRATKNQKNMAEVFFDEDEVIEDAKPIFLVHRAAGAKEVFQWQAPDSAFRRRHNPVCDACHVEGDKSTRNILVFCQGCSSSYHKDCLGPRSARQHLVTKIAEDEYVLQCKRCIDFTFASQDTGPRLSVCHGCFEPGNACEPFRQRKTPSQEQKEREANGGADPVIQISPSLLYQDQDVLFRCVTCSRAYHYEHLPSLDDDDESMETDDTAEERFSEYSLTWQCKDCQTVDNDVQALVAWRPLNKDIYVEGSGYSEVEENNKEYLIKWKDTSHWHCSWKPGPWVWGLVAPAMRKAFAKGDANRLPVMATKDAISEDYLRIDIIYNVRFLDSAVRRSQADDLLRISRVSQVLVKFKGLQCDNVVWDTPPSVSDAEIYADFKLAYENWVAGHYVHLPRKADVAASLAEARYVNFESALMKRAQPATLTGGTLMEYQMEGLNWLYYNWVKGQNVILADEMGLGKTIQIIGLLDTLVHSHQCWPLLVVVPNPTVMNWKREIQRWAPSLRAVTVFGTKDSVSYSEGYELFHTGTKQLKCHVVITSYQTPVDHKPIFKGVPWQGLFVDEGQRLKNDKGLLYKTLKDLSIPFRVLLTGTPLQNNIRELFNLLQFLQPGYNAASMEAKYANLNKNTVTELHNLIRPFFLRRTKAQVLTFLPPMAEIIVPVTMSMVQKKLYKSILAKNPDLIRSIFHRSSSKKVKSTEKQNLNNLLVQLRKCLCHPFIYSKEIEDRNVSDADSFRNLVEASSKLQLLELMLPKLKERGHRVLIFSQFLEQLDIIEDFLHALGLTYERLDGSMSGLTKQRRIDAFNAPGSELFAFLLSTRSGGVGINLATADTVIIMDPDFNPHQDVQALSRAHRLGQKKKVLVVHLMTRESAEERIMQIGKKKLSLDHVVIEQLGNNDDEEVDVDSVLKFGAAALFDDENGERDIRYSSADLDALLDRSKIETTHLGVDKSAENAMSFAKVWQNDKATFEDGLEEDDTPKGKASTKNATVWEKILKERELAASREAAAKRTALGRGQRNRASIDYRAQAVDLALAGDTDTEAVFQEKDNASDVDFQLHVDRDSETSEASEDDDEALSGAESHANTAKKAAIATTTSKNTQGRQTKASGASLQRKAPKATATSNKKAPAKDAPASEQKAQQVSKSKPKAKPKATPKSQETVTSSPRKTPSPKQKSTKTKDDTLKQAQSPTARKTVLKSSPAEKKQKSPVTKPSPQNTPLKVVQISQMSGKRLPAGKGLPAGKRPSSSPVVHVRDVVDCEECDIRHDVGQCLVEKPKSITAPLSIPTPTTTPPKAKINPMPRTPPSNAPSRDGPPPVSPKCASCNLEHEPGNQTCTGTWTAAQLFKAIGDVDRADHEPSVKASVIAHLQQLFVLAQAREQA